MRERGLTLIELAVTMAILGMLLAASMPSVGLWLANQRIRNTASSIATGLQFAQSEAVRRNQPVSFWLVSTTSASSMDDSCALSSSSGSWVVTLGSTSPAGKCATGSSTRQLKSALAGDGGGSVTLSALNGGSTAANRVTFNGFGQITSTTPIQLVNVTGSSGTKAMSVTVNSGGQVKVCDPGISTTTDSRYCS